jgi:hypothetical protein
MISTVRIYIGLKNKEKRSVIFPPIYTLWGVSSVQIWEHKA